jgi:MFS family permease
MHGDDDQIVPYADAGPLTATLVRNATLKTYKGFPHGMCTTQAETINADLRRCRVCASKCDLLGRRHYQFGQDMRLLRDRWTIAIAGSIVMLLIGTIYSWAIFTEPLLVGFDWDLTTVTWAYAIANFSLATLGTVIGGLWQDRVGPRRVAMTGVGLWGIGNVLAGLGTPVYGAPWLYVTYGVIGGVGAGMAYITPLAVVSKWFPERRGLAGGLVVGGFGLGAFIYNQWVPRLASFHAFAVHAGHVIAARLSAPNAPLETTLRAAADPAGPHGIAAVMHVFVASGLVFLIVGLPAASLLRNPPDHRLSRRLSTPLKDQGAGYAPSKVLTMPQFYLLWLQLFANVIAGVTIISNAVVILADLTRLPPASIAPIFGIVSIFNALGRFFWGGISDRIGCQGTFAAMFAVQALTLFLLSGVHQPALALAGFSVVLLCCGGGFGTMPSYSAQCFGTAHMGMNYGLVLSAWGFAGLLGPILVARARDLSGSFAGMMPLIAIVLTVSVILPFLTRKPARSLQQAAAI